MTQAPPKGATGTVDDMKRTIVAFVLVVALVGCAGDGLSDDERTAVDFVEAAIDIDIDGMWGMIHPDFKATTSRAEFSACVAANASTVAGDVDVKVTGSFVEHGATFVEIIMSAGNARSPALVALRDGLVSGAQAGSGDEPGCI